MSSQHRRNPLNFRAGTEPGDPAGDRAWLLAYAAETGRPYGAILAEALAEYRAAHSRPPGDAAAPHASSPMTSQPGLATSGHWQP